MCQAGDQPAANRVCREREDDWGVGAFGEAGYEFWIAKRATVGLSATYNYFDLSGDNFVSKAWFAGVVMNFNIYF